MSFSFNEPAATTPAEETTTTTTEEVTNADTNAADGADGAADNAPDTATQEGAEGSEDGASEAGDGKDQEGAEGKDGDAPETDKGEVSYYFGDEEVSIEIESDHREAFEAKGLDIDALAAELYSKEGGFALGEESYKKCCEAFGKFAIDAFISGLKAQNEATISGWKSEAEAKVKADEERFTSLCADIGGDEGWGRLETFAMETLSQEELDAFNEVMASGNQYLQQYAVRELEGRRKAAQGDDSVTIIEGNASLGSDDNAPLSAVDYIRETAALGDKFRGDRVGAARAQAQLDARRRAGMASGL